MSELTDFLAADGYVRVPLRRSVVGHFHTDGTLNGRPVEVLVTGSPAELHRRYGSPRSAA